MAIAENFPEWDSMGLLPPIWPGESGNSLRRAPYPANLVAFARYFATSPERTKILNGLLEFRKELHKLQIISGFQWVNGSFVEDAEAREERPPRDIDVVTFFYPPAGGSTQSLAEKIERKFNLEKLKENYFVDGYFMVLGQPVDNDRVQIISYWYSMWAHSRYRSWKGFVQIDLSPSQDVGTRKMLKTSGAEDHE